MNKETILKEKEKCFEQIEQCNKRLEEIRKVCKHEETFEGNYSWRVGNIQLAEICSYCGELIKFK